MNKETKHLIKNKRVLWNTYYRSQSAVDEIIWKQARNLSNNSNDAARSSYESKIILNSKNNPKSFWSYVKKRTKKTGDVSAILNDNTQIISYDDQDSANLLNSYFTSVFVNEPDDNFFENNKQCRVTHSIDSIVISVKDVIRVIDKLNISKAPGPDVIHARIIKESKIPFAIILSCIFNKSISEGVLPSQWKRANVKALF